MKAIERLYQYIKYKNNKHTRFEKELGLSNGYLGTQLKRNADLGESILNKIIDNCLDLNPEWLLTGKGQMLRTNSAENQLLPVPVNNQPPDTIPENNDKVIRELFDRLERLIGENTLLLKEIEELKKENEELKNKEFRPAGIASYSYRAQEVSMEKFQHKEK